MNPERLSEYCEQYLINNYHMEKERQKTNRFIALLIAITLISLFFIYAFFVVPTEELTVDGNSKAVMQSTLDHGSEIWQ